jgi:hypothetical protein
LEILIGQIVRAMIDVNLNSQKFFN